MQYAFVTGCSKPVSRVVLGTMIINRGERDKSYALLDAALAQGCTTLDTAHGYAGGDSERCIGDWIKDRNNRDQMVILTKGCHHNGDRQRVTPADIGSDLQDSLARLKADHVDIYLLHRDDTFHSVLRSIHRVARLVAAQITPRVAIEIEKIGSRCADARLLAIMTPILIAPLHSTPLR